MRHRVASQSTALLSLSHRHHRPFSDTKQLLVISLSKLSARSQGRSTRSQALDFLPPQWSGEGVVAYALSQSHSHCLGGAAIRSSTSPRSSRSRGWHWARRTPSHTPRPSMRTKSSRASRRFGWCGCHAKCVCPAIREICLPYSMRRRVGAVP